MLPVDFNGANVRLIQDAEGKNLETLEVDAYWGLDSDNYPFFLTMWKPNKEDIDAINAGRVIVLKVRGTLMPQVALYTTDETGDLNFVP